MTEQQASVEPDGESAAPTPNSPLRRYAIEVGIGVSLAALVLWAITAAGGDVTFVYQGL